MNDMRKILKGNVLEYRWQEENIAGRKARHVMGREGLFEKLISEFRNIKTKRYIDN